MVRCAQTRFQAAGAVRMSAIAASQVADILQTRGARSSSTRSLVFIKIDTCRSHSKCSRSSRDMSCADVAGALAVVAAGLVDSKVRKPAVASMTPMAVTGYGHMGER